MVRWQLVHKLCASCVTASRATQCPEGVRHDLDIRQTYPRSRTAPNIQIVPDPFWTLIANCS